MADDKKPNKNKDSSSSSSTPKSSNAYDEVSKKFQKELFAFIEARKERGDTLPKNKDDLIKLFLNETKSKDTGLHEEYSEYITHISGQTNIDKVTFKDIDQLPIGKDGRLSALLAERQGKNFENNKLITVCDIRKKHYTKAIGQTKDKKLAEARSELIKARFGAEITKNLLSAKKLLPTLQQLFDDFFKEHCDEDDKKRIGTYLSNEKNRPTLKTYLDAFAKAGENIQDKNVRDALVKDTKRAGKKVQGVQSLDKSIADLTHFSLLEEGILAREEKTALIDSFDNTFSHTEITTGIFKDLPRNNYLKEKKPTADFGDISKQIQTAKNEKEANQRKKLYEKKLLEGYLDRANEQFKKQGAKTPKAKLLEQLATISKFQDSRFSEQKMALITTISTYLQEDYLESQIDHSMVKAQFKKFGVEEIHFDDYLNFWKQIYDLENKEAKLTIGEKTFSLYAEKTLITNPDKFRSIDNLDALFSFERKIDFKKSDEIFSTLFGNTPQAYIVDDKTGQIIDTIDHKNDLPVYLDTPHLRNRLILDRKSQITITEKNTGKAYSGFPVKDHEIDALVLHDNKGAIVFTIPFETEESKSNDPIGIINTDAYTIEATKRTFSQPATPPIVTQLMQTAVFNELLPEDKKIPTKKIEEQENKLDETTPVRPHMDTYTTTTEDEGVEEKKDINDNLTSVEKQLNEEKFTSYRFASTDQIPEGVKKDIAGRAPPKTLQEVRAWINHGEVFFHTDYFYKKHHLSNISHIDGILTFTLENGETINIQQISELKRHPNILACIAELRSAKVHEVAHRLLHFHDITTVPYTTEDGTQLDISQETLCEIADRQSLPRQLDKASQRWFVTISKDGKQAKVRLDTLEAIVGETIDGFTRGSIRRLDANQLEAYEADYEKFADLVVANTLTPATERSVKTGNKAMKNKLDKFIKKLEEQYDPGNQVHIDQRERAEEHLEALRQQLAALNTGTPIPQDELDQMREAQIQANNFLQTNRPTQSPTNVPNQPTNNQPVPNQTANTNVPNPTAHQTTPNNPSHETLPEKERDVENDKKEFNDLFAGLKGDSSAQPQKGTVLFFKEQISGIPGRGFNRVKYKIIGLTDETITLEMSDATEKNVTKKSIVQRPRNADTIHEFKKIGKNDVYKYAEGASTKSGFMNSIKTTIGGKRAEVNNFRKTFQDKNKTKQEEITHVGILKEKILSSDRTESIVYKVDRGVNTVTVTASVPDGDKTNQEKKSLRTKKMGYDTFQMFCFSKELNPLTSTEVKRSGQRLDPKNIVNDGLPSQRISLAAIRKGLKAIPETYKKKFEEEQEFQTALATDRLSNILPNTSFLYLDEIKNDLGGTDGVIRQRIQKFKSERAATGDSDKASIHDKPIYENIEANIFNNIKSTRKFKYKAAGALLYTLEKGGAYARALSKYANKDGGGWWIKCILGETARQQFIAERQRKIDQFKSTGGSNEELQSEIVKFELQFLQDATTDKPGRGSKFGREIEGHKDTLYGGANSIDPSSFSKKGDFPYMLDAFRNGGIGQNIPWIVMSTLEAMKAAVESPEHLKQFYLCIITVFATGMVHMLPQDYINKLKGIGRSRGIPITLLAGDAHASGKVMRILNHISHNAGVRSFSEFSGYSLDNFDQMHIHNYDIENRKSLRDSFGNWWDNHGRTVMNAFNYKNDFLIDIPNENDPFLNEEQKKNAKIATDYLGGGGVFGEYKGFQDNESIGSIDGQSPFFQEGLLNLSGGAFRSYMMKFNSQGQLNNEHSVILWNNFSIMLDQFDTNIEGNKVMTKLLYKKFLQFFGDNELNGMADNTFPEDQKGKSYKDLFKMAVKGEIGMNSLIKKVIFKEKERQASNQVGYVVREDISDTYVKDTILKFAGIIQKSYKNLKDPAHQADILNE